MKNIHLPISGEIGVAQKPLKHRWKKKKLHGSEVLPPLGITDLSNSDSEGYEKAMSIKNKNKNPSKRYEKRNIDKYSTSSIEDIVSDSEIAMKIKTIAKRQAKVIYREVRKLQIDSDSGDESSSETESGQHNPQDRDSNSLKRATHARSFQMEHKNDNFNSSRMDGNTGRSE